MKFARVTIKVGCSWSDRDNAWRELRTALKAVADEVNVRLQRKLGPKVFPIGTKAIECSRLRARPGALVLDRIQESMASADFLLFDISPEKGHEQGKANVLFEVGIATGIGKRYYLVSNMDYKPNAIPSDLWGLCVAKRKNGRLDASLRATLVSDCRKLFIERNGL